MARVYRSRDHGWLSIHGGLTTMGRCSHFEAREVIVIARREREREGEEVIRVLTNVVTWRQSYEDDLTSTLNRGD
jgi:hypothetical protein